MQSCGLITRTQPAPVANEKKHWSQLSRVYKKPEELLSMNVKRMELLRCDGIVRDGVSLCAGRGALRRRRCPRARLKASDSSGYNNTAELEMLKYTFDSTYARVVASSSEGSSMN